MFPIPHGRRGRRSSIRSRDVFNLDDFVDDFFSSPFLPAWFPDDGRIKVDIRENEKEYIVEADLPGVKKDQINIELDNNILTIAVKNNEEVNVETENYIRKERRSSSYSRSFHVENIVEDKIAARFKNGVLTIVLPKKKSGFRRTNRIRIQ